MAMLEGKVALVTGSSQGIGRAIVERLAADGAVIFAGYLNNEEGARETVEEIKSKGGQAVATRVDIAKPDQVSEFFAACEEAFGNPDIVVNDAGVSTLVTLPEVTEEEYERVFDVNAKGTLFCLKEAHARVKDGGRVVNISSSTTMFPLKGVAIYAGSKAAVKAYTEAAALEMAERKITVNTVMPGVTESPMTERLPQEFKDGVIEDTPVAEGHLGRPADIADAVAFLVGHDARWITGQHILVNGGANH